MGCAPCAQAAANAASLQQTLLQNQSQSEPLVTDCGLNKQVLTTWLKMLDCVKRNQLWAETGLSLVPTNQFLGVIQSGLNYPDNYCYFYPQLQYFQENILPIIISNVPQCINGQ